MYIGISLLFFLPLDPLAQAPGTDVEILDPEVEGGRVGKVQRSSFTFVWGVFRVAGGKKTPPQGLILIVLTPAHGL